MKRMVISAFCLKSTINGHAARGIVYKEKEFISWDNWIQQNKAGLCYRLNAIREAGGLLLQFPMAFFLLKSEWKCLIIIIGIYIFLLPVNVAMYLILIYVYNESKKTTTKNAFLLKLLYFHREFCIADNFMNENAEDELLGVLSHEIGHLKHKKNIKNYVNYAISILSVLFLVYIIANPQICLMINRWIRDSFNISTNNYYLIITVYEYIVSPVLFFKGIYDSYVSRCEEYEADLEAVKNGYGEALIKTFKTLSSDQLVDVNPHPFIEFTEYDHPGMYQRIRAIKKAID